MGRIKTPSCRRKALRSELPLWDSLPRWLEREMVTAYATRSNLTG